MFANKPQSQGILPKGYFAAGNLPIPVWTSNLGIAYVIRAKGVN
jgi:hypothetical protein